MLGFINDCIEKYVLSKFGVKAWHAVKEEAGCDVKDDHFLKLENYHDESTTVLVEAMCELTGLSLVDFYRSLGAYWVEYIINEGYENLLCCQGHTLKEWMQGINSIHGHLQKTLPNKMKMPEFWCEENHDNTLALFYMSSRGSVYAPLAEGIVTEVAKREFKLDIVMNLVSIQGEEGARFTRYRILSLITQCWPVVLIKLVSDWDSSASSQLGYCYRRS
jgi:guanylate cyclase soluble subunit beta